MTKFLNTMKSQLPPRNKASNIKSPQKRSTVMGMFQSCSLKLGKLYFDLSKTVIPPSQHRLDAQSERKLKTSNKSRKTAWGDIF